VFLGEAPGAKRQSGAEPPGSLLYVRACVRACVGVVNMNLRIALRFKLRIKAVSSLYQFTKANNSDKSVRKDI
jgi:hypothetical protein